MYDVISCLKCGAIDGDLQEAVEGGFLQQASKSDEVELGICI